MVKIAKMIRSGVWMMAAAAMMVLSSCTKEEIVATDSEQEITLGAYVPGAEPESKTAIGESNTVLWKANDALGVFGTGAAISSTSKFTIASGEGTKYGTFTGTTTLSNRYFAIYPYVENALCAYTEDTQTATAAFIWNGSSQTAVSNSFDPQMALMAGSTEGDNALKFTNLMAFFKITTTGFNCKSIEISSENANISKGAVSIGFNSDGSITFTIDKNADTGDVTPATLVPPTGELIGPGTYYIAALPSNLNDFKVKVVTEDGITMTRSAAKAVTLKAGVVLNLGEFSLSDFDSVDGLKGSGTEGDPYLVSTRAEFNFLSKKLATAPSLEEDWTDKYYLQTADIDLNGSTACLGRGIGFSGTYDGGGYKISKIVLEKEKITHSVMGTMYVASLFHYAYNATIKNLTVECSGFEENTSEKVETVYGGIIGLANSDSDKYVNVENCTFTASQSASNSIIGYLHVLHYGGIIGYDWGNLRCYGCTNDCPVNISTEFATEESGNDFHVGGIIGSIRRVQNLGDNDIWCNLFRVRNNASITVRGACGACDAAGIVARETGDGSSLEHVTLRLIDAVNKGNISGGCYSQSYDACVGGLVAYLGSSGSDGLGKPVFYNCLNSGKVGVATCGEAYIAGLMARVNTNELRICAGVNVGSKSDNEGQGPKTAYFGEFSADKVISFYSCAYLSSLTNDDSSQTVSGCYSIIKDYSSTLYELTMNNLLSAVPSTLYEEVKNSTLYTTFAAWKGTWTPGATTDAFDLDF